MTTGASFSSIWRNRQGFVRSHTTYHKDFGLLSSSWSTSSTATSLHNDIAAWFSRHFWRSADWSLPAWIYRGLPLISPFITCWLVSLLGFCLSSRRRSILKILARKTLLQHHQVVTSTTQPHRCHTIISMTPPIITPSTVILPLLLSCFWVWHGN